MSSNDEYDPPHYKKKKLYMDGGDTPKKLKGVARSTVGKYGDLRSGLSKEHVSDLQQKVFDHLGNRSNSNNQKQAKLHGIKRHISNIKVPKSGKIKTKHSDSSDTEFKKAKNKKLKKSKHSKKVKSHKHRKKCDALSSGENDDGSDSELSNSNHFRHRGKKKHKKSVRTVDVYSSTSETEDKRNDKSCYSGSRSVTQSKYSIGEDREKIHRKDKIYKKKRRRDLSPSPRSKDGTLSFTESEDERISKNSSLPLYSDSFSSTSEPPVIRRLGLQNNSRRSVADSYRQRKFTDSHSDRRYSEGMMSRSPLINRDTRKRSYKDSSLSQLGDDFSRDAPGVHSRELKFNVTSNWSEERLNNARNSVIDKATSNQPFVDTHCHIDFLFKKLPYKKSYDDYIEESFFHFPKNFEGCIADWCQPSLYHTSRSFLKGKTNNCKIWGAFGCHPHFVSTYTQTVEDTIFKTIQQNSNVIAIGEMGLDYSDRFGSTDHDLQQTVFIKQLKIASKLQVPLVIHCRDADPDLVRIMKQYVPHDTLIHRHCLTTEEREVQELLDYFPNCFVGFTNLLSNKSAYRARSAATTIPLNRILLETDSPYFIPRCVSEATNGAAKFSHSGMAACVAKEIAVLKHISTDEVFKQTRRNVTKVYGI